MAMLRLLLCLLLVGCQSMASAKGHLLADAKNWRVYRMAINDKTVEFSIPPGESRDFSNFEIPDRLDLGDDVFDGTGKGPYLLRRFWDYRESRFVAVDGTLGVVIGVHQSRYPLVDMAAFKKAMDEASQRFEKRERVEGGDSGPPNPPVRYSKMDSPGTPWIRVEYKISGPYFVTPIDSNHYLKVSFRVGGFGRADWRADAQAAADRILRSIRIY